jgi:hypothetical protein
MDLQLRFNDHLNCGNNWICLSGSQQKSDSHLFLLL